MALLRYWLKFKDEDWTEVGGLVRSSGTSPLDINLCSTAWLSTTNTANFTLKYTGTDDYQAIAIKLISAQDKNQDVGCRITDSDGTALFYGYVDIDKLEFTSAKIPQSISITANDQIEKLDAKIAQNKIFKVGAYMHEVIEWLLATAADLTVAVWRDESYDVVLETPVVYTADGDEKYLDEVNKLLQELGGFVLVSDPADQNFIVQKIDHDAGGDSVPTVHYMVSNKLKSNSSVFSNDGVVVKYKNVKTSDNELVYMEDISISDEVLLDPDASYDTDGNRIASSLDGTVEIPVGNIVGVNGYYPLDSDVTKTYQEYDSSLFDYSLQQKKTRTSNEDLGIYYVDPSTVSVSLLATDKDGGDLKSSWYENVAFHSEEGSFDYPAGGEFHPKKAWQIFHNKLDQCVNVQSFIIKGVAVYSDREYRLVMPMECKDPYEYESSYISTSTTASALATLLTNLKQYGGDTSTWSARWSDYALGQEVYIEHPSATKIKAIVVKKTLRVIGNELWCDYTAIHNGNWSASASYEFSKADGSAPNYDEYVQAVVNGFNGTRTQFEVSRTTIVQYAVIPSKDDFGEGEDYGSDAGVYGFSADESYGDEYEWTTGQIDHTRLEPGEYIWMRTSTDGGTTWRYTRLTGCEGQVFLLKASSMTYNMNKRAKDGDNNQPITISVEVSGYEDDPVVSCTTDPDYLADDGTLTIPLNTQYSTITIVATLTGADSQQIVLTGVDVTEYGTYFGANATEEGALNGETAIDGDVYYNTTTGSVMVYKDGEWADASGIVDASAKAEAFSMAQKDVLSRELSKASEATRSYYGYFDTVITNTVNAGLINSLRIENSYTLPNGTVNEDSQGYPLSGYLIDGKSGVIKSYNSKFTNAQLKNAVIDSTSTFRGAIKVSEADSDDSTVLETVTAAEDENAEVTTALLNGSGDYCYYKGSDLVSSASDGDYQDDGYTIVNNSGNSYSGLVLLYESEGYHQRISSGSVQGGASVSNPYPFKTNIYVKNTTTTIRPNGSYTVPAGSWNPQYEFFHIGSALDGVDSSVFSPTGHVASSNCMYMNLSSGEANTGTYAGRFPYTIGRIDGEAIAAVARVVSGEFYPKRGGFTFCLGGFDVPGDITVPCIGDFNFTVCNSDGDELSQFYYAVDGGDVQTGYPETAISLTTGQSVHFYGASGFYAIWGFKETPSALGITDDGLWCLKKGADSWDELTSSATKEYGVSIDCYGSDYNPELKITSAIPTYSYTLSDAYSAGYHLLDASGEIVHTINSGEYFAGAVKPNDGSVPSTAWYRRGSIYKNGTALTADYSMDDVKSSTLGFTSNSYGTVSTLTDKITYASYAGDTDALTVSANGSTYVFTSSEVFTSLTFSLVTDSGLVGIRTANIEAVGSNNTIGKTTPFSDVYATTFHGSLSGNVEGNLKGNVEGNVKGDVEGDLSGDVNGTATNATNVIGGNVYGTVPSGQKLYFGNEHTYLNGDAANGGINAISLGDDLWLGDCNVVGGLGLRSKDSYSVSLVAQGKDEAEVGRITFTQNNGIVLGGDTYNPIGGMYSEWSVYLPNGLIMKHKYFTSTGSSSGWYTWDFTENGDAFPNGIMWFFAMPLAGVSDEDYFRGFPGNTTDDFTRNQVTFCVYTGFCYHAIAIGY